MGGTWDAWDNDPCYGGCGGYDSVTKHYRNKNTGEINSIAGICNGYCKRDNGDFPYRCTFQGKKDYDKYCLLKQQKEVWEEINL